MFHRLHSCVSDCHPSVDVLVHKSLSALCSTLVSAIYKSETRKHCILRESQSYNSQPET